jgi:hypothetical protein
MTPTEFATAIGSIESGNNPLTWGDWTGTPYLPQAVGRYQLHPAWMWEWAARLNILPTVDDTLDSWQTRLVEGFFTFNVARGLDPVACAVFLHLGHIAQPTDPDWNDQNYPQKFERALPPQP